MRLFYLTNELIIPDLTKNGSPIPRPKQMEYCLLALTLEPNSAFLFTQALPQSTENPFIIQ